jgi:hypothetical protein
MTKQESIYRKTDFSPEIAEQICVLLSEGLAEDVVESEAHGAARLKMRRMNVTQICRHPSVGITPHTLRLWLARYPDFEAQFNISKELYADRLMEEALEIADNDDGDIIEEEKGGKKRERIDWQNVQRARVRIDTRKLIAQAFAPHRYGDKIQIEASVHHDHAAETKEAKLLLIRNILEEANREGATTGDILALIGITEVNAADVFTKNGNPKAMPQTLPADFLDNPTTLRLEPKVRSQR